MSADLKGHASSPAKTGAALWFTGLPGCGKSTLALAVKKALAAKGVEAELLEMDARRRGYGTFSGYSQEERHGAYRMFADEAAVLAGQGRLVLMDATAPELAMRRYARERIPRFAEVHLRCRVATAMAREAARPQGMIMAGLYAKAVKRKATGQKFEGLGQVIGVDVPFEEDQRAELILEEGLDMTRAVDLILARFASWWS